jgi:hypothetical protein
VKYLKKKGQSAMEYLMTYGWAILIVIVVVAALYAMGVFKVGAPGGCSPCFATMEFTYIDHTDSQVALTSGPREISVEGSTYTAGDSITVGIANCTWVVSGDTCDVAIGYTVIDSGLGHIATATLHKE